MAVPANKRNLEMKMCAFHIIAIYTYIILGELDMIKYKMWYINKWDTVSVDGRNIFGYVLCDVMTSRALVL